MKTKKNTKSTKSNPNTGKALDTQIAFADKQVDAIRARLVPDHEPMTPTERRRVPRSRPGVRVQARVLGDLAAQYGLAASVSVDAMHAGFDAADRLQPLAQRLTYLATLVQDRVVLEAGASWKIASSIYTMLSRLSVDDPALASSLEPVAASFRRPSKKKGASTKTPPPAEAQSPPPAAPANAPAKQTVTRMDGSVVLNGAFVPSETK